MAKPVSAFTFLDDLKLLESIYIRDVRRPQVRDAIRRYTDRKFGTKQVGNDVLVTRIQWELKNDQSSRVKKKANFKES